MFLDKAYLKFHHSSPQVNAGRIVNDIQGAAKCVVLVTSMLGEGVIKTVHPAPHQVGA